MKTGYVQAVPTDHPYQHPVKHEFMVFSTKKRERGERKESKNHTCKKQKNLLERKKNNNVSLSSLKGAAGSNWGLEKFSLGSFEKMCVLVNINKDKIKNKQMENLSLKKKGKKASRKH